MKTSQLGLLAILALILIGASQSLFIVDEREKAIVLQLGQPVGDVKQPGLHFKLPVVQDVRLFDSRVLTIDPQPTQMVISSSKNNPLLRGAAELAIPGTDNGDENARGIGEVSGEPIVVDVFGRYRIDDPLKFLKTLQTVDGANKRIENIMSEATRSVLGNTTLRDLLSAKRDDVMIQIRDRVNEKIQGSFGVNIIDVRIVRADLTPALRQSTVQRMISELEERAKETRAKGREQALEIRATVDKEKQIILARAQRDAQVIRGEGDELAIKTYATAYNEDKEFFAFWRSMQAYRESIGDENSSLVLSPNSRFFRYFDPDAVKKSGQ